MLAMSRYELTALLRTVLAAIVAAREELELGDVGAAYAILTGAEEDLAALVHAVEERAA
jgi:hypothetical protein